MISTAYECHSCGAAASFRNLPETVSMRRVLLDVENDHARQHPECPYDRQRITLTTYDDD